METTTGEQLFLEKYGIEYNSLLEIKKDINEQEYYRQNFKILYHKDTDQYFSLWNTPYKHYIFIKNHGFITKDLALKKYYENNNI